MSSRRSRQQSASTRISDDQIIDLVSKLRQLVPEIRDRRSDKVFQNPFLSLSLYVSIKIKTCVHFYNTSVIIILHIMMIVIIFMLFKYK